MADSNNRTIAKNTIFLYFRMLFTMVVSLYTSRVVLQYLGVNDYGTYQTVGGIVGMLSFLNGVLSTGSSRFLTFELGRNDLNKLSRTFCTTLNIHILMAVLVVILSETVGLWFLYNKLSIPTDRMYAAVWVYQLSIITAVINITQIPYSASIISHENMGVYAYMSIIEVTLKLIIVYLLTITMADRLIVYALLLFLVQAGIAIFYRWYCTRHFKETIYKRIFDKTIFKEIFGFTGWTVITQISIALNSQGTTLITNMFFGPAVVTARAIAIQVNMAANQFVNNFRTAVNPQIVKQFASGDESGSRKLLLNSTAYSFFLMYMLSLPIYLLAEPLLKIWLGQIPDYAVIFLQLIIIQSLFCVFDTSFYMALYAKGRLKENAMISPMLGFIVFPVVYIMFKMGCSPVAMSWANLVLYFILGCIVKPILIHKIAAYPYKEILGVYKPCLLVVLASAPISIIYNLEIGRCGGVAFNFLSTGFVSFMASAISIWYIGLNSDMRHKIRVMIKDRVCGKNTFE